MRGGHIGDASTIRQKIAGQTKVSRLAGQSNIAFSRDMHFAPSAPPCFAAVQLHGIEEADESDVVFGPAGLLLEVRGGSVLSPLTAHCCPIVCAPAT